MASRPEYARPAWKAMRKLILARDGHRCQIRGPKCRGAANHVDHIVAMSQGGAVLDPSNLRAACASCNIGKRNTEVAARARGESVSAERRAGPGRRAAAAPAWCAIHEQPLPQCAHTEPWSQRWY